MAREGAMEEEDPYVMQSRLDTVNYKITEMEGQIKKEEREVLSLQKLLDESDRYLELKSELERASGVEILDEGDGYLELRLTTHVPAVRADFEEIYEHKLTVKLNAITMAIETAQLTPEDVPCDDLLSEVAKMSLFRDPSLVIYGGQEWCKPLPTLIARLRDRIWKKHLSVAKD